MNYSIYKNTYSDPNTYIKTMMPVLFEDKRYDAIALWDTAATRTHISNKIIEMFNLKPVGIQEAIAHRNKELLNEYKVMLILPTGTYIHDINVLSGSYDKGGFDVVVGMDIIRTGDLHMDYLKDKPIFTFKHPNDCDEDIFIETELF